jgi:GNAT superfamily N-acetyltransferase
LRGEKDLVALEKLGFDMHDAEDALNEYRNIERGDFEGGVDGTEEYQQERQDAWDTFIEEMGNAEYQAPEQPLVLSSNGAFANSDIVPPEYAPTGDRLQGLTGKPDSFSFTTYGGAHEVIWYGPDGQAHGYATYIEQAKGAEQAAIEGSGATPSQMRAATDPLMSVYVDPAFRRQGVATRMYDELEKQGLDFSHVTGKTVTDEGSAFTQARAARKALPPPETRTVAEINKAAPGTVYAPQKAALLPQDLLDEFGQRFIGSGKGLESNPDVVRAVQQFSKWSKQALAGGLLGDDPQFAELLTRITGIPTDVATPANHMHTLLVNQVTQAQRLAAEDAFRLQYFARNRSFLERSINHPFFGIYPASYMWGKIAPELARFMALEPFGVKTGALGRAAYDFQASVATQREFDPNFDKMMEGLGHSSVAWFLGYMLPSLPWDVGSAAPSWMRDIAAQGLSNQHRVDAGQPPVPVDLAGAIGKIGDYMNPLRPINQVERPIGEAGDILSGGSKADKQTAERAAKKSADRQAKLEKDLGEAIVAVQTAESRVMNAKSPASQKTAQARLQALNYQLQLAQTALRSEFPDSPKLNVQVTDTQRQRPVAGPPAPAPSQPLGFAPARPNEPGDQPVTTDESGENNRTVDQQQQADTQDNNDFMHGIWAQMGNLAGGVTFNPNAQLDISQVEYKQGIEAYPGQAQAEPAQGRHFWEHVEESRAIAPHIAEALGDLLSIFTR